MHADAAADYVNERQRLYKIVDLVCYLSTRGSVGGSRVQSNETLVEAILPAARKQLTQALCEYNCYYEKITCKNNKYLLWNNLAICGR